MDVPYGAAVFSDPQASPDLVTVWYSEVSAPWGIASANFSQTLIGGVPLISVTCQSASPPVSSPPLSSSPSPSSTSPPPSSTFPPPSWCCPLLLIHYHHPHLRRWVSQFCPYTMGAALSMSTSQFPLVPRCPSERAAFLGHCAQGQLLSKFLTLATSWWLPTRRVTLRGADHARTCLLCQHKARRSPPLFLALLEACATELWPT